MRRNTWASALLVSLTVLALQGCNLGASASIEKAKELVAKQDMAAAEIELKSFLQKNATSAEARYLLGDVLLKKGDAVGAQIELDRALEAGYDPNRVVPALATALLLSRKGSRVITELASRELTDPTATAALQAVVASALAQDGKTAQAAAAIDKAVKAAPEAEVALVAQAKFVASGGKSDEALKLTDALLQKHPRSEEGWALKGDLILRTRGDRDEAMAAYRKALEINATQLHASAAVVSISLLKGDVKAATEDLERMRKHSPNHFSTQYLDAELAVVQQDYERGRSIFQSLLKVAPDHPQLLLSSAQNELRLNSLAQAETQAVKAMTLLPQAPGPRLLLANVYIRRGEPAKAVVAIGPLAEREDASPDVLALAAQANMRAGNNQVADALFKRLAKAKPTDARLRTIIATSSLAAGGDPAAVIGQLQAISAEDAGITADLALVNARIAARQWDEALKAIDAIQRKQPDRPNPLVLRAQVLAQKGDRDGARKTLEQALGKDKDYMPAIVALAALDVSEQKLDAAKLRFKDLLERQPKNASALMALAEVAQRGGAPVSEVQGYLQRAVEADPQSLRPRSAMVDFLMARSDLHGALAAANAAAAALPEEVLLLQKLAQIQLRLRENDQALATYGKLTSLRPKSPEGHIGQAQVYLTLADYPQAERAVQRALERSPGNAEALALQVGVELAQKRYDAARDTARKVQAAGPQVAVGWVLESDVYAAQQQWEKAVEPLRIAVKKQNLGTAPIKLHNALVRAGKSGEAQQFATTWQKNYPGDMGFAFYMADSAHQSGRIDEAERRYREMLALQPDHPIALNNLAMLLLQQKKPGAQPLIDKALLLLPNEPTLLDTQADARIAAGETDKAIESLNRAATLAPRSPLIRLKLAKLLIETGEKAKAKAELDRLVDSGARLSDAQREELRSLFAKIGRG